MTRSDALREHMAGAELTRVCIEALEALIGRPPRTLDDWSIQYSFSCTCPDCRELTGFLRSDRADHDWPLSKERRQHLHQQIDGAMVPVLHSTRRQGRPYVLQLRKDRRLAVREEAHRARAEAILRELRSARAPEPPRASRPRGGSSRG